MMAERLLSYWEGNCSGAMLNFGGVLHFLSSSCFFLLLISSHKTSLTPIGTGTSMGYLKGIGPWPVAWLQLKAFSLVCDPVTRYLVFVQRFWRHGVMFQTCPLGWNQKLPESDGNAAEKITLEVRKGFLLYLQPPSSFIDMRHEHLHQLHEHDQTCFENIVLNGLEFPENRSNFQFPQCAPLSRCLVAVFSFKIVTIESHRCRRTLRIQTIE